MAYTEQTWVDTVSAVNATRLTHIEDGIFNAAAVADAAAPLASPALTGTPTAPDPTTSSGIATKGYTDSLVGTATAWTLRIASTVDKVVTSSTTLSADTDLNVPIGAGDVWFLMYEMEFNLASGGATGTDISAGLTFPTGATGRWSAAFDWDTPQGSSATARGALTSISSGLVFAMDDNGNRGITVKARIVNTSGAAGTVGFKWAQNVSSGSALTRLAYSHVNAHRVA